MGGRLICIEGLDGSGKTTLVREMARRFQKIGVRVTIVRLPGTTKLGRQVRRMAKSNNDAPLLSEGLLHFAAIYDVYKKVIQPQLRRGGIVIADRFYDSTVAYQGHSSQEVQRKLLKTRDCIFPKGLVDLRILVETSESISAGRLKRRRHKDRFDLLAKKQRASIRRAFRRAGRNNRPPYIILDNSGPFIESANRLWHVICSHLHITKAAQC